MEVASYTGVADSIALDCTWSSYFTSYCHSLQPGTLLIHSHSKVLSSLLSDGESFKIHSAANRQKCPRESQDLLVYDEADDVIPVQYSICHSHQYNFQGSPPNRRGNRSLNCGCTWSIGLSIESYSKKNKTTDNWFYTFEH